MTDRLVVQRDDIGAVVRVIGPDDELHSLDPDHAVEVGESIIRAGRELQTEQSKLVPEGSANGDQSTLDDSTTDSDDGIEGMLERTQQEDRHRPEPGDFVNQQDPMRW